ncbi:MAG: hypothetical protein WAM14_00190 [Candidatus Nitrosopolaris sp.]
MLIVFGGEIGWLSQNREGWSILPEIAPRYMVADVTVETGIAKVLITL